MRLYIVRALLVGFFLTALITGCRPKVGSSPTIKQSAYTPEEEAEAIESTRAFLKALDDESDTWEKLSQTLQSSTTKFVWSTTLDTLRNFSGKKIERGNVSYVFTEKLPDSPPGRYFICDVASKFERGDLTERIVLVRQSDQWKVAGYFRKKTITFGREAKEP